MPRHAFRWKSAPALARAPADLHPWLFDRGSLTARIRARCRDFQVVVLAEQRTRPYLDESGLVGIPVHRFAWRREVLLVADAIPVVFATSVLALDDLTGAWQVARGLGSRPLGAALFADPAIRRGPLEVTRLSGTDTRYRRAAQVADGARLPAWLWARRSRFLRNHRPLLVTEVFLPGICALQHPLR